MSRPDIDYLDSSAIDVMARVHAAVTSAAAGTVVVRVGEEGGGFRNVGVDLPRVRRSARESRLLRERVRNALEAARVVMGPCAIAPRVDGDLRCHVQVRRLAPSWGDLSGLIPPRPQPR